MPVTHTFVSAIADGADTTLVRPSDWNAEHAGNNFGWYNVRDYGAIGNGSADDTAALAAAIAACPEWGTVFLPSGSYKITSALTISKHLRILGSSGYPGNGTHIYQYTNNTNALTVSGVKYLTLENLYIENEGGTPSSGHGVYAYSTINTRYVFVGGFYNGIFVDGINGASYFSHLEDSYFGNNVNAGVYLDGKVNNIRIYGCRFSGNGHGLYASGGIHGASIIACDIETNTTSGITWDGYASSQNSDALLISGCYFEQNTGAQLSLGPTSQVQNSIVESCHFECYSGLNPYHIDVNYADRVTILGCHLKHDSEAGGIRTNATNTTNFSLVNVANECSVLLPATNVVIDPAVGFDQTASVTVANTNGETTLAGAGKGTLTIPANYLTLGRTVRVKASGYYGTTGTPTLRLKVKFGSTILCDTGANTTGSGISARGWTLEAVITCRTVGSSGAVIGQGRVFLSTTHTAGTIDDFTPNTSATTVNTQTTQAVDVTAQWGTASPSNTITCTNLTVEVL